MNLEIQIQSLITSFVYGLFISFTYNLLYKYLYINIKILKIILDIAYVLINTFIYYFLLLNINNGNVHPYFIGLLILGFIIGNKKVKSKRKKPIILKTNKKEKR